jgi:hypothetical protein
MRRTLGYTALVLGLTLVFLAPFLLLYAVPRIQKAPTDTDQVVVSNGFATVFSPKALSLVGPMPVQNLEVLKGDPQASSSTVAVVDYTSHLVRRDNGGSLDFDKEVYAFNRTTGYAANCCGETPKMSGVTLKFPFGTKQQPYQLWDPSANASFAVSYVRTDDLKGISAYVFSGSSPPTSIGTIDLPNSLVGVQGQGQTTEQRRYQEHTTVWIEPNTGQVLQGEKHIQQWAEDSSGTRVLELADVSVRYSDATVDKFVSDAKKNVKQLKLVKVGIPLFGGIAGVVFVIVGLFLLMGKRPDQAETAPARAAAA